MAVFIAAVFVVYASALTDGMSPQATDWAMYLMHARNIVHGRPYAETPYVFQPETAYEGPRSYPSGLALVLAPFYAVFGLNLRIFKIVTDAALALSLWPIYIFARRFLSARGAFLVAFATAFGWEYVLVQNGIGSDNLYQPLSFASIVFILWLYDRQSKPSWWWALLCGLLIAATYLARPIAIGLFLAVVVADVARNRGLSRFNIALVAAFSLVVLANNVAFHKDSSYNDEFIFSPSLVARHALTYLGYLSHVFASSLSKWLRWVLWALSLPLAIAGAWSATRRHNAALVAIYFAIVLAVLCVYWLPNTRYLLPIMPIYLTYILVGADTALKRAPVRLRSLLCWSGAAAVLIAPAANLVQIRGFADGTLVATPAFDQLVQQIESRTTQRDYILFWNPRVLALYTGRPCSPYPLSGPKEVEQFVDRVAPDYVVLDKHWEGDREYLAPVIDAPSGRYVSMYENAQFKIVKVMGARRPAESPPAAP